ncbi:variable surface lipoprotein [Mycoplasmopsis bovirhinis]|nr:variable surface lipoprotein [Mycoplasmopsis bovirhinis]
MKKKLLYLLSATSVLAPLVAVSCGQKPLKNQ